jgi:hypothetical protein
MFFFITVTFLSLFKSICTIKIALNRVEFNGAKNKVTGKIWQNQAEMLYRQGF